MTSLIFIFAEVLPKIYAIRRPQALLIFYTPMLIFFVWLLSPINFLIQKLIHFLLSFKKIKSNNKSKNITSSFISEEILIKQLDLYGS